MIFPIKSILLEVVLEPELKIRLAQLLKTRLAENVMPQELRKQEGFRSRGEGPTLKPRSVLEKKRKGLSHKRYPRTGAGTHPSSPPLPAVADSAAGVEQAVA